MFLMIVTMGILCAAALLRAAPPAAPCAALAARYAPRYHLELASHGGTHRALKMQGRAARLVVWGARGEGRAESALLRAALRHGLGYDAVAASPPFDVCATDMESGELTVAAAARFDWCARDTDVRKLVALSGGLAGVRRAALWARPPPGSACAAPALLRTLNASALASCGFLTLGDLKMMELILPPCGFEVGACTGGSGGFAVLAAGADRAALQATHLYICNQSLPLTLLLFNETSCFRKTLQYLHARNSSYLFLDDDLKIDTSDLLEGNLVKDAADDRCPARRFNKVTELQYRIGDGTQMRRYAPQIADVVERFCPSLKDLQEISNNQSEDEADSESAACRWALQNQLTFESWITNKKQKYILYIFLCIDDRLNNDYFDMITNVTFVLKQDNDFDIEFCKLKVECHDGQNMTAVFTNIIENYTRMDKREAFMIGVVAWSSSAGVADMARTAGRQDVPLALVGPAAPDAHAGGSVLAVGGRLGQLAEAYRDFIGNCGWSRLAILWDGLSYAKSFTTFLLAITDLIYSEKIVTTDTVEKALRSLQKNGARVIIVNTNSSLAIKILQSASQFGMTPPLYTWIVREWSPIGESAHVLRGVMVHFSLSTAGGGAGSAGDGHAVVRASLDKLWGAGTWPTLAVSLADAWLSLHAGLSTFERLYSSNPPTMRRGKYAMSISEILDKTGAPGVQRNLSFHNGYAENVMVYLERWHDGTRTVVAAWPLGTRAPAAARCTVRVLDRPACSFPAGGRAFVQRCYDVPMYSLLVALALLPVVFAVARRARLKRLQIRDLNLLAQISEGKRLSPVVHGDLLCIHKQIGTGNFGNVYLATLRQSREKPILVAAKALRDDSGKEEYLHEAGTLQVLDHENIVKFIGICVSNGSLLILMEYAHHGDLLQYLRSRRHLAAGGGAPGAGGSAGMAEEREAPHVRADALSRLAREAAGALQYLARRGLVHRDVRAANCLIDERRTLKLADFGMARRVCDNHEYTTIRCAIFPVLWMAPESLSHGTFSSASDVWSLGMLCLELATLGARPYGTCAPHQVLAYVRSGGRPPLPSDASSETVSLVTACWRHDAAQRPRAEDVERFLARRPLALRPALLPVPDALPAAAPAAPTPHSTPDVLPSPATPPRSEALLAPDVLPTMDVLREHSLS